MIKRLLKITLLLILIFVSVYNSSKTTNADPDEDKQLIQEREASVCPHNFKLRNGYLIRVTEVPSRGIIRWLYDQSGGTGIDLSRLFLRLASPDSPFLIETISNSELKELLLFLSKYKVQMQWEDEKGQIRTGITPLKLKSFIPVGLWEKTNAATALLFMAHITTKNTNNLVSKILAAAPREVVSGLSANSYSILSSQIVSKALLIMVDSLQVRQWTARDSSLSNEEIIENISGLAYTYSKYWAQKNPRHIEFYLKYMVDQLRTLSLTPEKAGVILGSLISGMYRWALKIKNDDVSRIFLLMMYSGIIGSLTAFIPLVGLVSASPHVIAAHIIIAGAIRTGAVVVPNVFAYSHGSPRDFMHIVRKMQGRIEMCMLQLENPENKDVIDRMLKWMRCSIHLSGYSD